MGRLFRYHFAVRILPSLCLFVKVEPGSRVLRLVSIHNPTMPLHIACMYHLQDLHSKLFMLAHEMVDQEPENPISWYAVGVWYLSGGKWHQARQYFRWVTHTLVKLLILSVFFLSKTSLMDPRFAPAWVAFGHTFALEGEHDHAVTAYSTCARMFAGYAVSQFTEQ